MGEHPVDHNSDKTKGMENLENSLTHLRGQMINILRQQEYQRVTTPASSAFTMTVMLSRHPGKQMSRPPCCRRRRRVSGKSARTPTAKFCGGPWSRPLFCCQWGSGRWNVSKTSSLPKSLSEDVPCGVHFIVPCGIHCIVPVTFSKKKKKKRIMLRFSCCKMENGHIRRKVILLWKFGFMKKINDKWHWNVLISEVNR